jgi:hypothetical protein
MNTKTVLKKIMTLLSKEEVLFTYAKLADGTIVESATFDVGETLDIVSEDGEKTPAPDGEHELSLRDEEGEETLFKVITEGGVIKERENVELEDVEVQPLPNTTDEPEANKVEEMEEQITEEEMSLSSLLTKVEEMSYRIEELEKKLKMADEAEEEVKEEEMTEVKEEEMEEEDDDDEPKLDGAPMESQKVAKFSKQSGSKVPSYQSSFLKKLYN